MTELTPNLPQFRRSGRWIQTDSGSLIASWASASISFVLASSSLSIRLGPRTKHRYTFGLESTTLVCTLSDLPGSPNHPHPDQLHIPNGTQILTFPDAEPGLLSVFDRLEHGQKKIVEITLVDWSSVLELVSIVVDSLDAVQAPPDPSTGSRLLFIGDSISCGFAPPQMQMLIPRGSLDAFTSRAAAHLAIPHDIVAYPGITLVDPEPDSVSFNAREDGMVSRFFLASSAASNHTPARLDERPTIIVIALGTNDRAICVEPAIFVQTMRTFVARLVDVYRETLAHICIIHLFPSFGVQLPSAFPGAFSQIAEQVPTDHPSIGVHVWDLGKALNRRLTIDRLHPTVQGHAVLGEALAGLLRQLIGGP